MISETVFKHNARESFNMLKTIKAGTIIYCWSCTDKIAVAKKDLTLGAILSADKFEGIQRELKNGDRMICKKCGSLLLTEKGFCTFKDL